MRPLPPTTIQKTGPRYAFFDRVSSGISRSTYQLSAGRPTRFPRETKLDWWINSNMVRTPDISEASHRLRGTTNNRESWCATVRLWCWWSVGPCGSREEKCLVDFPALKQFLDSLAREEAGAVTLIAST